MEPKNSTDLTYISHKVLDKVVKIIFDLTRRLLSFAPFEWSGWNDLAVKIWAFADFTCKNVQIALL